MPMRWIGPSGTGRFRSRPFHVLLLLLAMVIASGCEQVDGPMDVDVEPDSWMRIEGTISVNSFTCTSDEVYGGAEIPAASFSGAAGSVSLDTAGKASLRVPVHSLDCGRKAMNEDLYEALKVGSHPEIGFRLLRVEDVGRPDEDGEAYEFNVVGALTIAGVEREVEVRATGEVLGRRLGRAYGRKQLSMSDFDIDPPTAVLGLVKVQDQIEVVFDVVGSLDPSRAATGTRSDGRSARRER
ncbi:MAG: YceI family protein [Rhodothermales bacterium]